MGAAPLGRGEGRAVAVEPAGVASKLDVELADLGAASVGDPAWDEWYPGSEIYLPCG